MTTYSTSTKYLQSPPSDGNNCYYAETDSCKFLVFTSKKFCLHGQETQKLVKGEVAVLKDNTPVISQFGSGR